MALNIAARRFTVLDRSDHENIAQNAFLKLLRGGFENFHGGTEYEFLKYFKTIVVNEGISYLKSQQRSREQISLNGEVLEGLSPKDLIADPNPGSRPDVAAEAREIFDLINGVLRAFSLVDRQLFVMKSKGYKDEEVKEILGIPLGTVASKYSRIKARLHEEFERANIL